MFNNIINRYDLLTIVEKIKSGDFTKIIKKVFKSQQEKVKETWEKTKQPPINSWDIPEVNKRITRLITGNENIGHCQYVKNKYFNSRQGIFGLSLGCGGGNNEIKWAKTGMFKQLDAYDLSENRIEYAKNMARKQGLDKIVRFLVRDILVMDFGWRKYDLIIFEGSLHHFSSLAKLLDRINDSLAEEGLIVVKDYVGPNRLQWSDRQLEVINVILKLLPAEYKKKWQSNKLKKRVYRPSRLRMILNDPSEAIESAQILPLLKHKFDLIEFKELGGTILLQLFFEIAYNFIRDDVQTKKLLQLCFEIEDVLMAHKEISSDMVFAVYQKIRE